MQAVKYHNLCDPQTVAEAIRVNGVSELPGLFDPVAAQKLVDEIKKLRKFDRSLFLTQEEWEASPKSHRHTNPGPGTINMLDRVQPHLGFIEENPEFKAMISAILGPHYRIYLKKLVCRLPPSVIPGWVMELIGDKPANTLNAFMRPECRDFSFYYDVDVHQDIIEWPRQPEDNKEHRLLYMYIHLGDVAANNSPLNFFIGSHKLGATPYQHEFSRAGEGFDEWRYRDPATGRVMNTRIFPLVGGMAHAALWHGCTLHGSHPARTESPRIALRYVLARDKDAPHCLLDDINQDVEGPLYLEPNFNAGHTAKSDGSFTLAHNDFTLWGRGKL